MGRPRKYANEAEKQAAFRNRYPTVSVRVEQRTKETLAMMSQHYDESEAEIVNAALKYFFLNYAWQTSPLFGKRLPRANPDGG
jgi:hypothetical protein